MNKRARIENPVSADVNKRKEMKIDFIIFGKRKKERATPDKKVSLINRRDTSRMEVSMKEIIINTDKNKQGIGKVKHYWSNCVGAGRACEGLRADWRRQLREARRPAASGTSGFMACSVMTWESAYGKMAVCAFTGSILTACLTSC